MAETVSDLMLQRLIDWGVDTIFGLPGDGINGFMEALRKREEEVRFVHVRHEETAALAAVGYAKFSGRLGVCLSTAAPGAVHLLNGLYDAAVDQAPVLALTGMTYHDLIGTHYLQDINHDALFEHVCGYSQRIMGSAQAVNVVDLACRTALTQRTGGAAPRGQAPHCDPRRGRGARRRRGARAGSGKTQRADRQTDARQGLHP